MTESPTRNMGWILAVVVAVPIATGFGVALWAPGADATMESVVAAWIEIEVLLLVAAALILSSARGRSERRRAGAVRRLREQAVRDPMTGLLNRRGLVAAMSALDAERGDLPGSWTVTLIDLDDFKGINDSHGHTVGDEVLIAAAGALAELESEGWLCARLGGDEFVLARYGAPVEREEIDAITVRIPAALDRAELPVATATAGAAGGAVTVVGFDELIRDADADLGRIRGEARRPFDKDLAAHMSASESEAADLLERGSIEASNVEPQLQPEVIRELGNAGKVAAVLALAIGLAAIVGVLFDFQQLRSVEPQAALSLTTAATISFAAATLLAYLIVPESSPRRRRIGTVGGAVVILVGVLGLAEHLTGSALIPTGLVSDPLEGEVPNITRPDIETATIMILGGAYMILLGRRRRSIDAIRTVASIAMIGLIVAAVLGFSLDAGYLWPGNDLGVSPQGAIAAALIAIALLAAQPRQPAFWPLTLGTAAARTTRRLLLAGIAVPMISGAILIQSGLESAAGWAIAVIAAALIQAAILAVLVVISARDVRESEAEVAALYDELRELADRDPLTGLYNRGKFDRELARLITLAENGEGGFSIVLIDLDNLKELNESAGYGAGDAALRAAADRIERVVRPTDLIARMGGDEFGVLLPGATRGVAEAVFMRCADQVASLDGRLSTLTLSWGVAEWGSEDGGADDLVAQADRRLYRSKASGRH